MPSRTLLMLGVASISACSSNPGPTDGFEPTHASLLVVTTRMSSGTPLDSVAVTAVPVDNRRGDFGTSVGISDARGRLQLSIERFTPRVSSVESDTVRFAVSAQALKQAFLLSNAGQPVVKTDTVLLTLRPFGQAASVDSITFVFGTP